MKFTDADIEQSVQIFAKVLLEMHISPEQIKETCEIFRKELQKRFEVNDENSIHTN